MARSFNGTSDKITLGSNVQFNFANNFTLAAWIFPTSVITTNHAIISHGQSGYYLRINTSSHLDFLQSTISDILAGTTAIVVNTWNHVAVTLDGSHNLILYLNGAQEATGSTAISFGLPTRNLVVGVDPAAGTNAEWFAGNICEVLVLGGVLSANEIKALALGSRSSTVQPSLLPGSGYWPLWGLSSPEPEMSGNVGVSINGVLTGTAFANHAPITTFTGIARSINPVLAAAAGVSSVVGSYTISSSAIGSSVIP